MTQGRRTRIRVWRQRRRSCGPAQAAPRARRGRRPPHPMQVRCREHRAPRVRATRGSQPRGRSVPRRSVRADRRRPPGHRGPLRRRDAAARPGRARLPRFADAAYAGLLDTWSRRVRRGLPDLAHRVRPAAPVRRRRHRRGRPGGGQRTGRHQPGGHRRALLRRRDDPVAAPPGRRPRAGSRRHVGGQLRPLVLAAPAARPHRRARPPPGRGRGLPGRLSGRRPHRDRGPGRADVPRDQKAPPARPAPTCRASRSSARITSVPSASPCRAGPLSIDQLDRWAWRVVDATAGCSLSGTWCDEDLGEVGTWPDGDPVRRAVVSRDPVDAGPVVLQECTFPLNPRACPG